MSKAKILKGATITGLALIGAACLSTTAAAMDSFMVGSRATGMAGATVASTSDLAAQYYNPAAFAFMGMMDQGEDGTEFKFDSDNNNLGRKDWGIDLNVGLGYRLHNEFGSYLDGISEIDPDSLSKNGIQNIQDLENLIHLAHDLTGLDDPGNAASINTTFGLGLRVKHFAIGGHSYIQAYGRVLNLDTTNLGINVSGSDLNADILGITMPAGYATYTPAVFDSSQRNQLAATGLSQEAINRMDYIADHSGLATLTIQETVDLLASMANQSGSSTLDDNQTMILLNGFGVIEVPITYGHSFNEHFGIGANFKLMRGRVYGNQVLVVQNDSGQAMESFDEQYQETTTFGLDIGVMARFPKVNLGLVCRNLNGPTFDGLTVTTNSMTYKVDDVKIDPSLTFGAAFIPFETLTLESDLDLTTNETALPGYDSQYLRFGLEWDAFRFLALRVGAYKNLAESDIDWVYAAGLGLNLWAVRLDLGANMASSSTQYDGEDIPKELNVQAQLSIDF
ncbi:MAG: conjugal transfer protein TraF [Proteobacteria bacterium]|nr:conjugal transfer protein TraF [Pseudomonadota bacterium]MBU1688121.1 conjugal transfer protein TraF [Pseudomonadota bacterium]